MNYLVEKRQNGMPILTMPAKRVLIVEDNAVHRRLMENELRAEYDVKSAADSETALAYLRGPQADSFDLVVLDLFIPEHVGDLPSSDEAIKVLRDSKRGPAVVIISGSPTETLRSQLGTMEVKRIFEKPFSLTEFREYVDSLLGEKQLTS